MSVDKSIVDKIKKMLELADPAKNDNQHQVELAMRKAQEFMRAHGLSMADVAAEQNDGDLEIGVAVWRDEERSQYDTWVRLLAHAAGDLMGCKVIIYRSGAENRYRCSMAFIGEETDVQIAGSVWPWLVKHGRKAARNAVDGGWCSEHRSFVEGFAARICARVDEMLKEAQQANTPEDERYLMVLDAKQQAIKHYVDTKMNLSKGRKTSLRGEYDPHSAALGAAEGDKVNLNFRQQLGGSGERRLLN